MTSFIICSIDPEKFRAVSSSIAQRMAGLPHEIVGVHDARSMCEGYNRGVARAIGERLVFCHDDIELLAPDFAPRLAAGLDAYDVVGVAGTDKLLGALWLLAGPLHVFGQITHYVADAKCYVVEQYNVPRRIIGNIQALDGVFFAARRHVLEKVRFDEETFLGWHVYDMDFTFSAHLAGFRLAVCCDLQLLHGSVGNFNEQWERDAQAFIAKHAQQLGTGPKRRYQHTSTIAADKADALALMTPPWWDAPLEPK